MKRCYDFLLIKWRKKSYKNERISIFETMVDLVTKNFFQVSNTRSKFYNFREKSILALPPAT